MSGWYIDPVTGKKITLGEGETLVGLGLIPAGYRESAVWKTGYAHTSWLDKLFSWGGKIASAGGRAGLTGGAPAPGVAPFEWLPKISITRPPSGGPGGMSYDNALAEMLEAGDFLPAGNVGEAGAVASSGSAGLMPWAIGAAVVVGLLFFVKFK